MAHFIWTLCAVLAGYFFRVMEVAVRKELRRPVEEARQAVYEELINIALEDGARRRQK